MMSFPPCSNSLQIFYILKAAFGRRVYLIEIQVTSCVWMLVAVYFQIPAAARVSEFKYHIIFLSIFLYHHGYFIITNIRP